MPGRRIEFNLGGGNFRAQFRRADRSGAALAVASVAIAGGMVAMHRLDLRPADAGSPRAGDAYFEPSLVRTSHGGFIYYEVLELLAGLAKRGRIVGVDLVEVAPDYDHTGGTAILAAQVLMNLIGRIMHARGA